MKLLLISAGLAGWLEIGNSGLGKKDAVTPDEKVAKGQLIIHYWKSKRVTNYCTALHERLRERDRESEAAKVRFCI